MPLLFRRLAVSILDNDPRSFASRRTNSSSPVIPATRRSGSLSPRQESRLVVRWNGAVIYGACVRILIHLATLVLIESLQVSSLRTSSPSFTTTRSRYIRTSRRRSFRSFRFLFPPRQNLCNRARSLGRGQASTSEDRRARTRCSRSSSVSYRVRTTSSLEPQVDGRFLILRRRRLSRKLERSPRLSSWGRTVSTPSYR